MTLLLNLKIKSKKELKDGWMNKLKLLSNLIYFCDNMSLNYIFLAPCIKCLVRAKLEFFSIVSTYHTECLCEDLDISYRLFLQRFCYHPTTFKNEEIEIPHVLHWNSKRSHVKGKSDNRKNLTESKSRIEEFLSSYEV